jgi:hypothetical protein
MINVEKKTVKTSVTGIGDMELSVLQIGNRKWLTHIEIFITQNQRLFTVIAMNKPELQNPLFLQRAIQAFIKHIQSGGEEQTSSLIANHFRNWINKQNGTLKTIIYGEQTSTDGTETTLRDSVKAEFNRRYGGGQQTAN